MNEDFFRAALGRFATGVCVITTRDAEGPIGFTATSLSSVSLDPPLVLFCLGREATVLPAFERASSFAVSMLAAGQEAVSVQFSVDPRAGFADGSWETGVRSQGAQEDETMAGAVSAEPMVRGRLGGLVCTLERIEEGGDHRIFIGRVRGADWDVEAEPLLYYRGRYRTLAP